MDDEVVFYQKEDVWHFATEKYRQEFQPMIPYHMMMHFYDGETMEFIQMIPFTPRGKNVMNGCMAGRCDFPHYGKLIIFKFPKGIEIFGPRQIEARIDQDQAMSKDTTLWRQMGSEVIQGHLLVVPIFDNAKLYVLYAEPVYLQAEGARMPEIKKIVLADQERIVWADTFQESISLLTKEMAEKKKDFFNDEETIENLIPIAVKAFKDYQEQVGNGRLAEAGAQLDLLNSILEKLLQITEKSQ